MSISNCTELAWKYRWHWNRKLLSLSGSVLLKVSGMRALVPIELVLDLGVWLELRVLASRLSTLANCSLVLLLRRDFDCKRVEDVGLLVILLLVLGLVGASSQLGSLSTRDDTWARNRWNYPARLNYTRRRPQKWTASLMDSSWMLWHIWQISHLVTETWDRVERCPKRWDQGWRIVVRGSYLDFEVWICKIELQAELWQRI